MAQLAWNNPGNIGFGSFATKYGAIASGTSDTGHYIAQFPTPQAGVKAMGDLALSKYNAGKTSLNDLIAGPNGWTPGNYTAAGNVAKTMGISPTDDLKLNDPSRMSSFQSALAKQEGYGSADQQSYFGFGQHNDASGSNYVANNQVAPAGDIPASSSTPFFNSPNDYFHQTDQYSSVSPGSSAFGLGGANYNGVQSDQSIAPAGAVDGHYSIEQGVMNGNPSATSAPDPTDADPHDVTLGEITVQGNGVTGLGPSVAPVTPGTTQAQAGTNSTAYAGDIEVAPAIDTLARSVAASAQSQNAATASASNALKEGLGDVGKQISSAGQTTASATTGLANQIKQSADQTNATAQDIKKTSFAFQSNMFIRVTLVIVGAIFLIAALRAFTGNSIIPASLKPGAIAKRGAKAAKAVA